MGYSVFYLIIFGIELYIQRQLYFQTLLFNPSKVVFIFSLFCYLLIVPMRFSCEEYGEDILTALAIIFQSTYILYLGRYFFELTKVIFLYIFSSNTFLFIVDLNQLPHSFSSSTRVSKLTSSALSLSYRFSCLDFHRVHFKLGLLKLLFFS